MYAASVCRRWYRSKFAEQLLYVVFTVFTRTLMLDVGTLGKDGLPQPIVPMKATVHD